jgi:hypothetical protein
MQGVRLGILSGAPSGALIGFFSILYWSIWSIVTKLIRAEPLGASDPVTLEGALANAVFNAIVFGIIAGAVSGATIGAAAGFFIRRSSATNPQVARRLGIVLLAGVGVLLRPVDPLPATIFIAFSALLGAAGGWLGDRLFARLYRRRVGAHLRTPAQGMG